MFGISMQELMVIFVVALLVLGPNKLPDVAKTLGKVLREFRKASDDLRAGFMEHVEEPEPHRRSLPKYTEGSADKVADKVADTATAGGSGATTSPATPQDATTTSSTASTASSAAAASGVIAGELDVEALKSEAKRAAQMIAVDTEKPSDLHKNPYAEKKDDASDMGAPKLWVAASNGIARGQFIDEEDDESVDTQKKKPNDIVEKPLISQSIGQG